MRIVLGTGAAGFLGSAVARHLAAGGAHVVGVDRIEPAADRAESLGAFHLSPLETEGLARRVGMLGPEACVHCAGGASVGASMADPAADFRDGPVATAALLEALRRSAPACRTVLLSSAAVYGDPAELPVAEDAPLRPLSPYGFHKMQTELLAREYHAVYHLPTASLRIFSAYGEGLRRQVLWDICRKALAGRASEPLALLGTGRESRDFVHAEDVARAAALVLEQAPLRGEAWNVGSGTETTVREAAETMLAALGLDREIVFDGHVPAGTPRRWRADIGRIRRLGFAPEVAFAEGASRVAARAGEELAGG